MTKAQDIKLYMLSTGVQILGYTIKELKTSITLLNPCFIHLSEEGLSVIPVLDPALTEQREFEIDAKTIIISSVEVREEVKNAYRQCIMDIDRVIEDNRKKSANQAASN